MARHKREVPLTHPGEILLEDFLKPMGLSQNALALALRVPSNRINQIVIGERGISPDTALRLARFFGTTAEFWVNLQAHYDLSHARDNFEDQINREVPRRTAAT